MLKLANNTQLQLEGSVTGLKEVQEMVKTSPQKFRNAILKMLIKERDSFIGSKSKNGLFRRSIMRKKTGRGNNFPEKLAKHFKGYVNNNKVDLNFDLEMGLLYKKPDSRIKKAMIMMATGGEIKSTKLMPIPNKKNPEIMGLPSSKLYPIFKSMISNNKLVFVKKRNKGFWIKKDTGEVMFFGTKQVKIKQKFKFQEAWDKRVPKVIEKYKSTIDKVVTKLNKGN